MAHDRDLARGRRRRVRSRAAARSRASRQDPRAAPACRPATGRRAPVCGQREPVSGIRCSATSAPRPRAGPGRPRRSGQHLEQQPAGNLRYDHPREADRVVGVCGTRRRKRRAAGAGRGTNSRSRLALEHRVVVARREDPDAAGPGTRPAARRRRATGPDERRHPAGAGISGEIHAVDRRARSRIHAASLRRSRRRSAGPRPRHDAAAATRADGDPDPCGPPFPECGAVRSCAMGGTGIAVARRRVE